MGVVKATPRPLYPRERDPIPVLLEAGWAPGPVWTGMENLAPIGIRSPDRPARIKSLYPPLTITKNVIKREKKT